MASEDINILVVLGPTASGKTDLAIKLAQKYNGEIIAADSRTIYKDMDIGTAKPTTEQQLQAKHWGIDLIEPGKKFSVVDYKKYALSKINEIRRRGKKVIIVGGSGLYIDAVIYDYSFAPVLDEVDDLEDLSLEQLKQIITANKYTMPQNSLNKRYLIGEIKRAGQNTKRNYSLPANIIVIGLFPKQDVLQTRIRQRIDQMLELGVIDEYNNLVNKYGINNATDSGIYKVIKLYEHSDEFNQKAYTSDWHLARKQMIWFKRNQDINRFETAQQALAWLEQVKAVNFI